MVKRNISHSLLFILYLYSIVIVIILDLSQISQSSESVSHEKIAHDLKMKLDERSVPVQL